MRPTIFVPVFIYIAICTVPLGVGLNLLLAPIRTGNLLHDAFAIFPALSSQEAAKRRLYRLLGLILIAGWAVGVSAIYSRIVGPFARTLFMH
jgi:hypothetical protein